MKKLALFFLALTFCTLNANPTIHKLEEQNKILELQIKQEELKNKLNHLKNTPPPPTDSKNHPPSLDPQFSNRSKDSKRTWILTGFGLGLSHQKMGTILDRQAIDVGLKPYTTFALNAQIGGMTMWNRYFGLQYYYNLDVNIDNSLKNQENTQCIHTQCLTTRTDILGAIATSTFNVDAVMNAYHTDRFGVGFTAGFGIGFDVSKYKGNAITTLTTSLGSSVASSYNYNHTAISFDARFNFGMRFIFDSNFALSLNLAVPFLAQAIDPATALRDYIVFSTRFVYARF